MKNCEWPVDYSGCAEEQLEKVAEDDLAIFEQMAADFLRTWTMGAFGICEYSVRPRKNPCRGYERPSTYWGRGPYPSMGMTSFPCGCQRSCGGPSAYRLPRRPQEIISVTVDGEVLDPSEYAIMGRYLVRVDGTPWPVNQNCHVLPTEPGTWEVVYTAGAPVPVGGQIAAGLLALNLWLASCEDDDCALPERVKSIVRQGVSMEILDEFSDLQEGRTGIWLVDSWVASVLHAPRPGAVYAPRN